MTIGANLNGGSLTIVGTSINMGPTNTTIINMGGPNTTVNVTSGTINASLFKLYSTYGAGDKACWLDTIRVGNSKMQLVLGYFNASEVYLASPTTPNVVIGGDGGTLKIANDGLVSGARVNIATGTNAANTEMYLGSPTLTNCYIRGNVVNINDNGTTLNLGKDNLGRVELRGSIVVLNGQGGDLNLGGVSSGTINLYRPLTVVYTTVPSMTQIGGTTELLFASDITGIPYAG